MEKSILKINCTVHISFLLCIVAVITLVSNSFKLGMATGNETDRLALLAFKDQLVGASHAGLHSWNASLHFCEWQGVRCGRQQQRVIGLSLPGMILGGSIPPSIGNLSFLREANLYNNSLQGNIPSEFGQLRRLRSLNLSQNNLQGNIPLELGNCSNLVFLNLSYNSLSGEIPSQLGDNMKNLIKLSVASNDLGGGIPSSLGNLSSLDYLRLERNHFEGVIPDALGRLSSLKIFSIAQNNLSGIIPSSIYNLSSSTHVSMALNNLSGDLAPQLGSAFRNLETLYLGENQFTGRIPRSVANISGLKQLDINSNGFTGLVPDDLGKLRNLLLFDIHGNDLGFGTEGDLDFLSSLSNCSRLQYLVIHDNRFGGTLPDTVASLSAQLEALYMGGNQISGSIPQGIGNLYKLTDVYLGANLLTGKLPVSIGHLQNLGQFDLSLNHLTGEIPSSIGNLSRLVYLHLNGNDFQGRIPLTLRECKDMEELDLSLNKLGGTVPDQLVAAFQSLITLNLSHNSFNGSFPSDISNSKNLVELYVDNNNFSGEIPEQLGGISELRILHMQGNNFQGSIPRALGSLQGTELPKCFDETATKKCNGLSKKSIVVIIISLSLASVSVAFIAILCCRKQLRKDMIPLSMQRDSLFQVSYKELVEATNGFSALNFLGEGSFGNLDNQQATSSIIKGTIGYLAPECGMGGPTSPEGDIYSYGILVLEMITGKRPTDDLFGDGDQNQKRRGRNMLDCLASFTNVGVACSVEVPVERMKIEDVVTDLHAIKARLLEIEV
ncbi:hypothetical protein V6N11_029476 [Hibiscus sabdariffa]|uniref:Leucine-rich repeat-containing N-terminal plant-type domain-containing protein n=1 Tax=Hibiscus sabdariffa TaxID=183260 RepID=A0ABR2P774_9ROSI